MQFCPWSGGKVVFGFHITFGKEKTKTRGQSVDCTIQCVLHLMPAFLNYLKGK
jgi:hypothetical protein